MCVTVNAVKLIIKYFIVFLNLLLNEMNLASVPCQIGEKIMVEVREGRISPPSLVYSARTNFFDRFNLLEAWNEPQFWKVTVVLLC